MNITKTITLNIEQYSLIQSCLNREIKDYEEFSKLHDFDTQIKKLSDIINLIDSAESKVELYEENK